MPLSLKISWFYRKTDNIISFSCTNISTPTNFKLFTVKTDIRNMSESNEFRWENDSKSTQDVHYFIFFFWKNPITLKKNKKRYSISFCENRNTYIFNAFSIKNVIGKMSQSAEFRFENSLDSITLGIFNRCVAVAGLSFASVLKSKIHFRFWQVSVWLYWTYRMRVCLKLMPTTNKAARESNLLSWKHRDWSILR